MRGVVVGSDEKQEWLLSWWWENYRKNNSFPVAFADFGMSEAKKRWCKERGALLPIDTALLHVSGREAVDPLLVSQWETSVSPFWPHRSAWFKKPLALQATPFEESIWLDLDCEVLGSLEPIYAYLKSGVSMALVKAKEERPYSIYNGGVIAFQKKAAVLQEWMQLALAENHRFLGDQDALSYAIEHGKHPIAEMPPAYNWLMCRGVPVYALIRHWAAEWGKEYLKERLFSRKGHTL